MAAELTSSQRIIEPFEGKQTDFLTTTADIAFYGGLPGGGKSVGLLLEVLGNHLNPRFVALILRRIREDLTKVGGIWDASKDLYAPLKTKTNDSDLKHTFPSGCVLGFGAMKDARKDHERYKSVEADLIAFEELPEFERHQFWYMLSRNRGKSGIKPYVRATMNPQAGWVFRFLNKAGYVNNEGFAIPEMSGVIRWFYRDEQTDDEVWFDSEADAWADINAKNLEDVAPMSFTFILAGAKDNPYQRADYVSKLSNLSRVDRARLKHGNWKIENDENGLFKRSWWNISMNMPPLKHFTQIVCSWDIAHTEKKPTNNPAFTAGFVGGLTKDGRVWIFRGKRFRESPLQTKKLIRSTTDSYAEDFGNFTVTLPDDPAAGKAWIPEIIAELRGHRVKKMPPIGDKVDRASVFSDAVENGMVTLVLGDWNDDLINEGSTFPYGTFKDQIDACSDLYDFLTERKRKPSGFIRK